MKTTTVKLPPELDAWLTAEARSHHTTKSSVIRDSLKIVYDMSGKRNCPTFGEINRDLAGIVKNTPRDLSSNPKHMEGYGD